MRILRAITAIAVVCLLMPGCGDSTGPVDPEFDATITGDLDLTVSGDAVFGVSTVGGVDRWTILLSNGELTHVDYDIIGIGRHASGTPIGVGTHMIVDAADANLGDEDIDAVFLVGRHDGSFGVYGSVSGTLTITAADSDVVTGEFSFTATMAGAVGPYVRDVLDLDLSGTFTAVPGTIPTGVTN